MEKLNIEDDSSNGNCTSENNEASKLINDNSSEKINTQDGSEATTDGNTEHPEQIQQWLAQILRDSETEPIMHEFGQIISKIPPPKPRLYREFPAVET